MSEPVLFLRPVTVAEVPRTGKPFAVATSEAERAAVADLLGLPAIAALSASLDVEPFGADGLSVSGEVHAHVTEICVVTSEPFDSDIVAPVEVRFSPDGVDWDAAVDLEDLIDPDAEDPPDRLKDGRIDLGAIVTEFLALALDPYPRKPGVAFEPGEPDPGDNPFAALEGLKDGPGKKGK